jgi:hypothetical protein
VSCQPSCSRYTVAERGRLELYDLRTDIGEKEDLAVSRPDKAIAMQQLLTQWREQVAAQMPRPRAGRK